MAAGMAEEAPSFSSLRLWARGLLPAVARCPPLSVGESVLQTPCLVRPAAAALLAPGSDMRLRIGSAANLLNNLENSAPCESVADILPPDVVPVYALLEVDVSRVQRVAARV